MGARVGRSITPPPRLALTLHQPFNAFKPELTCSQLGWDNSCKPEIQAKVITPLVRQGDFRPSADSGLADEPPDHRLLECAM